MKTSSKIIQTKSVASGQGQEQTPQGETTKTVLNKFKPKEQMSTYNHPNRQKHMTKKGPLRFPRTTLAAPKTHNEDLGDDGREY